MHSNPNAGDISEFNVFNIETNASTVVTLHNNNIDGRMPSHISLNRIEFLTMFNRLS